MALLLGWQFTASLFLGGLIMIVLVAVAFRLVLRERLLHQALAQAHRGVAGSMEGHAAMDMSIQRRGGFWQRLPSGEGFTSVSHGPRDGDQALPLRHASPEVLCSIGDSVRASTGGRRGCVAVFCWPPLHGLW